MDTPTDKLRSVIRIALADVDAPIGVLVDSIILPYALDRSFMQEFYMNVADTIKSKIDRLQKRQTTAEILATMVRYPAFVSDRWLHSISCGSTSTVYHSIQYESTFGRPISYAAFNLSINGRPVASFRGCPSSGNFLVYSLSGSYNAVQQYIEAESASALIAPLKQFAQTGRINVDDWLTDDFDFDVWHSMIPIVHAWFRLNRLVSRGVCCQADAACDGCRTKTDPPALVWSASSVPFPDEFYDF